MAYQETPVPPPLPYQQVKTATTRRTGGNNGCLWIGLNLLLAVFLGIGGWYGWGSYNLTTRGGRADGTVVAMDESNDDDGTTYAPIVGYEVDGERYEMNSHNYSSPPAYHVGQKVTILYNLADPNTARIDSFWDLWLLPIIFIGLAVPFGLIFNAAMLFGLIQRLRSR
ncbi:MAG: DUF3592 domain-containing protein [Anaerolineales bacterium]